MTDRDKAIYDLDKIIYTMRDEIAKGRLSGATPMPLRTVKQSFEALILEDDLLKLMRGFEVTKERALKRIDAYEQEEEYGRNAYSDVVELSCQVLRILAERYFTSV